MHTAINESKLFYQLFDINVIFLKKHEIKDLKVKLTYEIT